MKNIITALTLIASISTANAASYKFLTIKDGHIVNVAKNCSGNWARTSGAARSFEKNNAGAFTRLVRLENGTSCPANSVIPSKKK